MGRIKSEYPTGCYGIRNKPNAKGEVVIYLTYYLNCVAVPRPGLRGCVSIFQIGMN